MQQERYIRLRQYCLLSLILLILCLPYTVVIPRAESIISTNAPIIFDSSVDPTKVRPGDTMTVTSSVIDLQGVEKVEARFFHEKGFDIVYLSRTSGSKYNGVWEGSWEVHDTLVKEYITTVTAFSSSDLSSFINLTWFDPVSWWDMDWSYRKKITLDSSQVPGDLTNFPVLISITDSNLSSKAQSNGDDIAFTDSSGTQLNHEIESYTSGTGNLIAWVNVTSLSSSIDTEIYMYYGNSGCSNQQDIANVWDSNFKMVQHLNETSGTHYDSTSNDNDGTEYIDLPGTQDSTGKIDGADEFDGDDDYVLDDFSGGTTTFTLSAWIKPDVLSGVRGCTGYTQSNGVRSDVYQNGQEIRIFYPDGTGSTDYQITSSTPISSIGQWYHIVGTFDGTTPKVYVDGINHAVGSQSNAGTYTANKFWIGRIAPDGNYEFDGVIDEVRISNTNRSADWITTEYNNINNATDGGFFTLGDEELATPTKPILKPIDSNNCTNSIRPTFQWYECDNTNNYTLYVDSVDTFSSGNGWNVTMKSPYDGNGTDINPVVFKWNTTTDSTINTTEISNINYFQLEVDDDSDFTSPLTLDDETGGYVLNNTVKGKLYWHVRAVDNAGNVGNYSEYWNLTVFNFNLTASPGSFDILKGNSQTVNLNITIDSGCDTENVTLSTEWSETLSDVTTSFSTTTNNATSWSSTLTITVGGDAPTEEYTCFVNATSASGVIKSEQIVIDINQ